MAYVRTVAATVDPLTLDELKDHCRIDGNADDAYLSALLRKAVDAVERANRRQLCTATYVLYLDCFPEEIRLEILPVTAVTSIAYTDTAGASQVLSSSLYQTSLYGPDGPARIMPAYGQCWPNTRSDTYDAVRVTFTAGYGGATAVPPHIREGLKLLVGHWYENREPITPGSEATFDYGLRWLLSLNDTGGYA